MARKPIVYQYCGKKMTRDEIAEMSGLGIDIIAQRLARGWSIEKVVNTAPRKVRKGKIMEDALECKDYSWADELRLRARQVAHENGYRV